MSEAPLARTPDEEAKPRLPKGVRLRHDEMRGEWLLLAPERVLKADAIAVEILKRCTGERSIRERPMRPSTAWVKITAVNRETIVPMPSVNANPLTPAVARTKRMNAVSRVITFASMIVAIPFL